MLTLTDFKPGDRVETKGDPDFEPGHKATVVNDGAKMLCVEWDEPEGNRVNGAWFVHRFQLIEPKGIAWLDQQNPNEKPSRGTALARGDRMNEYGPPAITFGRIAAFWRVYLIGLAARDGLDSDQLPEITPEDVGHMMNLLKISRSITDKKADTLDDIDGYTECIRMLRNFEGDV